MFQRIGEIFKELPTVIGIADDVLIIGYDDDGTGHNRTVFRVLQICRKNPKLKTIQLYIHQCPFFREIIFRYGVQLDPQKQRRYIHS